jgi:hypothetical protein
MADAPLMSIKALVKYLQLDPPLRASGRSRTKSRPRSIVLQFLIQRQVY